MIKNIVLQFISAINSGNVKQITDLMSNDHCFTDSIANTVTGKEQLSLGWEKYLQWFPDYHIDIESILHQGDEALLSGYASGTYAVNGILDKKDYWRLPASWKASVKDGKISHWQVFADTKLPSEIMERNIPATQDDMHSIGMFGGVFFKANDPKKLAEWYDTHLGTNFGENSWTGFKWRDKVNPALIGETAFSIFDSDTTYFEPGNRDFMLNFRVMDLKGLLTKLREEGVQVVGDIGEYDFGKFGWIIDPEGNKIELWEPVDEVQESSPGL